MRSSAFKSLIVVCAILALPSPGCAQKAVVSGTVTDTRGGLLPGVGE
jgi:hypothetical protein